MQVLINEPLKEYVNYKIGGKTPKLYIVNTISDLVAVPNHDLQAAYVLGAGTNILVSDAGVDAPVLKVNIKQFVIDPLSNVLTIGSGFVLTEACEKTVDLGFDGLVNVSGIPGTVGGGVFMNASASHGAISDTIIDVEAYNKDTKQRKVFTKEECNFGFRQSVFQNSPWIITFVRFQLKKGNAEELKKLYNEIVNYRKVNYPLTFPSAGCWFRRDWGGKEIIKKIGMSGAVRGKAVASPMFPAFILNTGNATAEEVYGLVKEIQDKAKAINEDMPCEIVIWGKI